MIFTVDDLCLSHLRNFVLFDAIKQVYPDFRLVAFAIGNYQNKESLVKSDEFLSWFRQHKDWVEIGVHSYDHEYPPDGDRDDEKYWIERALESLRPFLPDEYSYRSPGWQTTHRTVPILCETGFRFMYYESKVSDLRDRRIVEMGVINSHLYDPESIRRIERMITR